MAINGFGRIGRLVLRAGLKNPQLDFVAVNDLTDAKTLAHLFKYDSTFGIYPGEVRAQDSCLWVDGKKIQAVAQKDPAQLPWKSLGVELAVESTGRFTQVEKAKTHLTAGARKVILTAPAKGEALTLCMGVNENQYDPERHSIVSNASCTTNCLVMLVKVLQDHFRIKRGFMTTVHSYTNDQVILDFPHTDLRRARSAGVSLIPTTTGAAQAIGLVMEEMKGKLNGIAVRVPTQNVSLVDFVAELEKEATRDQVNQAFRKAAEGPLRNYLQYCEEPLVSRDFLGNSSSCIFDASYTDVIGKNLVKVFGWYDNEWGYANRVVDLAAWMTRS
ncbi:MAG: type I glyceraldehyde-3-phosphate dehydrogenase [Elusimicrobia bacterium]|nr:type I glyceraldehyde-3-phosphate dehydrogenase [Elusimicrobiota bacterium]